MSGPEVYDAIENSKEPPDHVEPVFGHSRFSSMCFRQSLVVIEEFDDCSPDATPDEI